jgi:hypothetical protein
MGFFSSTETKEIQLPLGYVAAYDLVLQGAKRFGSIKAENPNIGLIQFKYKSFTAYVDYTVNII